MGAPVRLKLDAQGGLARRRDVGGPSLLLALGQALSELQDAGGLRAVLSLPGGKLRQEQGPLAVPRLLLEGLPLGEEALLALHPELDLILDLVAEDFYLMIELGPLCAVESLEIGLPFAQDPLLRLQAGLGFVDLGKLGPDLLLESLPALGQGFLDLEGLGAPVLLDFLAQAPVLGLQLLPAQAVVALELLPPRDEVLLEPHGLGLLPDQGFHVELSGQLEVEQVLEFLVVDLALRRGLGAQRQRPSQGLAVALGGFQSLDGARGAVGFLLPESLDDAQALEGPAQGHAGGVEVVDRVDLAGPDRLGPRGVLGIGHERNVAGRC